MSLKLDYDITYDSIRELDEAIAILQAIRAVKVEWERLETELVKSKKPIKKSKDTITSVYPPKLTKTDPKLK